MSGCIRMSMNVGFRKKLLDEKRRKHEKEMESTRDNTLHISLNHQFDVKIDEYNQKILNIYANEIDRQTEETLMRLRDYFHLIRLIPLAHIENSCNKKPHLINIHEKYESSLYTGDDTECEICFDVIHNTDEVMLLDCKHIFHIGCLNTWCSEYHGSCPKCRKTL